MSLRTAAKIFGYVFVLIGILGFVPALTPDDKLLGIFEVNTVHNLIHLASGIVALAAGYSSYGSSKKYFQIFGIVYGLVTLLGIFYGNDDILGIIAHNTADIVLHAVITIAALTLGFGSVARDDTTVTE